MAALQKLKDEAVIRRNCGKNNKRTVLGNFLHERIFRNEKKSCIMDGRKCKENTNGYLIYCNTSL